MTTTDQRAIALVRFLEYVRNTGGNATIMDFDDDWAPIGPTLRDELMPKYFKADEHDKLRLTDDGERILASQKA